MFVIALSGQNGVPVTDRIVAVGLLTGLDVERLGRNFKRLWSIDETPRFSGLLQAIDEADRQLSRDRNKR